MTTHHHKHHENAEERREARRPSIVKPLVPIMILGGVLLVLVIAARFFQEEMRDYESRGASGDASANPNTAPNDLAEQELMAKRFPDTLLATTGIRFKILREGTGPKPIAGSRVRAHYAGRLLDGTEFDSSIKRGEPFEFKLLAGQVIRGWDLTILDMHQGEKRMIVLPSRFAYGTRGDPPKIPPRAPLVFEIELVGFE
jgi:FKBP-type peptidyl-prolyl cis-trans isomerase